MQYSKFHTPSPSDTLPVSSPWFELPPDVGRSSSAHDTLPLSLLSRSCLEPLQSLRGHEWIWTWGNRSHILSRRKEEMSDYDSSDNLNWLGAISKALNMLYYIHLAAVSSWIEAKENRDHTNSQGPLWHRYCTAAPYHPMREKITKNKFSLSFLLRCPTYYAATNHNEDGWDFICDEAKLFPLCA